MTDDKAIELIRDVAATKALVEDMHERLFGNGQPGLIEKHHIRLDSIESRIDEIKGAAKVIHWVVGALSAVTGTTVWHMITGKH